MRQSYLPAADGYNDCMTQSESKWMLYGANGYTGRLIAKHAVAQGQRPILAGRNEQQIREMAAELDCPFRIFGLKPHDSISSHLTEIDLVLNCAGPFIETAEPMISACLSAGVHYLDITGEWKVIEAAAGRDEQAKFAGVVIMPAVGFDVVPSDCLSLHLAQALPDANRLELAFKVAARESAISPGTATTIFSQLGEGTFVRENGKIQKLADRWQSTKIPFASGERSAVAISWGDIASAYHSTGIPNIRVYQALSEKRIQKMKRWNWLLPLTGLSIVQSLGRRWIKKNIPGPTKSQREKSQTEFWGRATNAAGQSVEATLTTPEGYTLTSRTSVEIVRRVLAGEVPPGFATPAKGLGAEFIENFEDANLLWKEKQV